MRKAIRLHPGMGPQIIHFLSRYANLPAQGILAGQAVASAIEDLWGLRGTGVYNDLDVFRVVRRNRTGTRRVAMANNTADRFTLGSFEIDRSRDVDASMGGVGSIIDGYGIESVTRQGMLNYVNCHLDRALWGIGMTAHRVIGSFDLNCVRVAVDLQTGRLFWDHHFERFLETRVMEITSVHTPWHTFLRLCKKREELAEVTTDLDAAAAICAAVGRMAGFYNLLTGRLLSLRFGKKHHDLLVRNASDVSKYFAHDEVHLVQMGQAPWPSRDVHYYSGSDCGSWGYGDPRTAGSDDRARVTLWSLEPRGFRDEDLCDKVRHLRAKAILLTPTIVYSQRRGTVPQDKVKLEAVLADRWMQPAASRSSFVCRNAAIFETGYVAGSATTLMAARVDTFVGRHPEVSGLLLGRTLAEQASIAERIEVVSCLADGDVSMDVIADGATSGDVESDERLHGFLQHVRRRESRSLAIQPLKLPALPRQLGNFEIRELLTAWDLRVAAVKMGWRYKRWDPFWVHYDSQRVLLIRRDKLDRTTWSTLTLFHNETGDDDVGNALSFRFCHSDHHGYGCGQPPAENEAVARYLCSYLENDFLTRWAISSGAMEMLLKLQTKVVATLTEGFGRRLEHVLGLTRWADLPEKWTNPEGAGPSSVRERLRRVLHEAGRTFSGNVEQEAAWVRSVIDAYQLRLGERIETVCSTRRCLNPVGIASMLTANVESARNTAEDDADDHPF